MMKQAMFIIQAIGVTRYSLTSKLIINLPVQYPAASTEVTRVPTVTAMIPTLFPRKTPVKTEQIARFIMPVLARPRQ